MTQSRHVIVIGGGITGLTAAFRLSQQADAPAITLVEAGDRLGGKLRTENIDGFLIDSGPESLAPGRPNAAQLVAELGINLVESAPGAPGAVLVKGRVRAMPDGLGGFMPRKFLPLATTNLITPLGKIRMATEPLRRRPADNADESVQSFATRRLGKQAYDRLIEPVASGIFGGDPATMSILATLPFLRAAEAKHGALVKAVLAERKEARSKPASPRRPGPMTPPSGMAAIAEALVERLNQAGVEVLTSSTVTSLAVGADGYDVTIDRPDGSVLHVAVQGVIIATPTHAAAAMMRSLGAHDAADTLREMGNASTTTVSLGYAANALPDLDRLLPAHGYLIAEPGRGAVRSVTRSSAKYPGRAPVDHELFRVTVRVDDPTDDAGLVQLARDELARTLSVTADPVMTHVQRWTGVMPQYSVGHLDRVAALETHLQAYPRLVIAGSGVHGLGIPDCVFSGERAAAAVGAVAV